MLTCAKLALRKVIEGNCFYIIPSILLVWRRSDLFNVSLQITGYVSLHNQTPLHITLSKLVFTSHCICFYYIMICPVSPAYTIGVILFAWHWYIGCWLWTGHCFGYLFSGYLFPVLFANQILICFMSAARICHRFCLLCNNGVLADFEQVIVPVLLYLVLFAD